MNCFYFDRPHGWHSFSFVLQSVCIQSHINKYVFLSIIRFRDYVNVCVCEYVSVWKYLKFGLAAFVSLSLSRIGRTATIG